MQEDGPTGLDPKSKSTAVCNRPGNADNPQATPLQQHLASKEVTEIGRARSRQLNFMLWTC